MEDEQRMAKQLVTVNINRTDGKAFELRDAQIETTALDFDATGTATVKLADGDYRLFWTVIGKPGTYKVQILTPPEAVDPTANNRERKITQDTHGSGLRTFTVGE
jgi:hypothetical protein